MLAPLKVDTYNYNQTKSRARIEFRTDNYCMNENIGIGCGLILHNFVRVLVDCSTEAEPKICKSKFSAGRRAIFLTSFCLMHSACIQFKIQCRLRNYYLILYIYVNVCVCQMKPTKPINPPSLRPVKSHGQSHYTAGWRGRSERCPAQTPHMSSGFHRFHISKFSNGLAKHSESQRNIVKHCRQNMPKSCTNWVWGASPWRVRCFSRVSRPQVRKMVRLQPESIQSFHGHHGPCVGLPKKTRRASLCFFLCSPGTGQSKAWMFDGRACSRGKGTNGFGRIWPNYVKQSCYNDAKRPSMGWHVVAGRDRNNISATHTQWCCACFNKSPRIALTDIFKASCRKASVSSRAFLKRTTAKVGKVSKTFFSIFQLHAVHPTSDRISFVRHNYIKWISSLP